MATLDRISYTAIAVMEFIVSQVGFEVDASGHAPVLQNMCQKAPGFSRGMNGPPALQK
jgi:hypothetical protein